MLYILFSLFSVSGFVFFYFNISFDLLVLMSFLFPGTSFSSLLRNGLSKLGVPSEVLEILFKWADEVEDYPKIPEARGAIKANRSEAFFIPLYELLSHLWWNFQANL